MSYSLTQFRTIWENGFSYEIPQATLDLISMLASQVGSSYPNKTSPVFTKNAPLVHVSIGHAFQDKRRKRNGDGHHVYSGSSGASNSFQTQKPKKTGIHVHLDLLRSHLNKLSDKNKIDLKKKIMTTLEELVENEETPTEDLVLVSQVVFEIASTNRFYSKLYAELFGEIIAVYDVMKQSLDKHFDSFLSGFQNIQEVNPEANYDLFCKVNKENEERRALSAFFVNLSLNQLIDSEKMVFIICQLFQSLLILIAEPLKIKIVDEITENLALLCSEPTLWKTSESCDFIQNSICTLAKNENKKNYPSLSKKSMFKFMEMVEQLH